MSIQDTIAQAIADQQYFTQPSGLTLITAASAKLPCYYNPVGPGITYLVVDFLLYLVKNNAATRPISADNTQSIFGYKRNAAVPALGVGAVTPLTNATTGAASPLTTLGSADSGYSVASPSIQWAQGIDVQINTLYRMSEFTNIHTSEPAYIYPGDLFGCLSSNFKSHHIYMGLYVVKVGP